MHRTHASADMAKRKAGTVHSLNEITIDKARATHSREHPARTIRTHTVGVRQDSDRLNIRTPTKLHVPRGDSPHSCTRKINVEETDGMEEAKMIGHKHYGA
ncbi:unnamed protein product [Ectocarpus sp. 13 AM-2016]